MSESIILTNLIKSEAFARRVIPFLHQSYFPERTEKLVFESIVEHYAEFNMLPTKTEIRHHIENKDGINDDLYEESIAYLGELVQDDEPNFDWLVQTTEKFCQDKAIYNAIMDSIGIIDGSDKERTNHAIPELLKDALSVSFDTHIGHDYFEEAKERFEFYSMETERIPFDLEIFNMITNGGIPNKTLNMILAGTNVGKSLIMIHLASSYLLQGKNVLYITLEMAEEAIANRVDANLMSMPVNQVERQMEEDYMRKIHRIQAKTQGKLIVKEFPTSSAHVGHIRTLLQELQLKKNFKPDVIMVDYINIMASSRVKLANTNSYFYIKAIAEELRGLAVEKEIPIWSATQSNRSGQNDSDVDLTNTSESFGLPATVDFMFAAIRTEELDALGQIMIKQLKSRYGNKNYYEKFVIGIEADQQKLYDLEDNAQTLMQSSGDLGPTPPPDAYVEEAKKSLKF